LDVPQAVAVGVILDISDDGMRLALTGYFLTGSTVELECEDCVLRGAVIFCSQSTPRGLDTYGSIIGIRIKHVAWDLAQRFRDSTSEPLSAGAC